MDKNKNSSDRERLKLELSNVFSQLKLEEVGDGIKVSVPNGSKSCNVTMKDGIYTVRSSNFLSTYKRLGDAVIEIMEDLVCREMFDNNFNSTEIGYVVSKLIK